jgi:RimJ/RimL family protein N-acetyltransferase
MSMQYPIRTARLYIEPFQAGDGDALYGMERDPEVKRYAGGTLTREQTEKMLHKFIATVREAGYGPLAIKLRHSGEDGGEHGGEIIGLCGFYATTEAGEAEIFYGLAREAWGKGYATEAGRALIKAGIEQLGLKRIIAPVNPENQRSMRVLEKIGMTFSHVTTSLGQYETAHLYVLGAAYEGQTAEE